MINNNLEGKKMTTNYNINSLEYLPSEINIVRYHKIDGAITHGFFDAIDASDWLEAERADQGHDDSAYGFIDLN